MGSSVSTHISPWTTTEYRISSPHVFATMKSLRTKLDEEGRYYRHKRERERESERERDRAEARRCRRRHVDELPRGRLGWIGWALGFACCTLGGWLTPPSPFQSSQISIPLPFLLLRRRRDTGSLSAAAAIGSSCPSRPSAPQRPLRSSSSSCSSRGRDRSRSPRRSKPSEGSSLSTRNTNNNNHSPSTRTKNNSNRSTTRPGNPPSRNLTTFPPTISTTTTMTTTDRRIPLHGRRGDRRAG